MFIINGAVAKHTKNAHKRCPVYSYIYTTQQTKNRDKTKIDTMDILHREADKEASQATRK